MPAPTMPSWVQTQAQYNAWQQYLNAYNAPVENLSTLSAQDLINSDPRIQDFLSNGSFDDSNQAAAYSRYVAEDQAKAANSSTLAQQYHDQNVAQTKAGLDFVQLNPSGREKSLLDTFMSFAIPAAVTYGFGSAIAGIGAAGADAAAVDAAEAPLTADELGTDLGYIAGQGPTVAGSTTGLGSAGPSAAALGGIPQVIVPGIAPAAGGIGAGPIGAGIVGAGTLGGIVNSGTPSPNTGAQDGPIQSVTIHPPATAPITAPQIPIGAGIAGGLATTTGSGDPFQGPQDGPTQTVTIPPPAATPVSPVPVPSAVSPIAPVPIPITNPVANQIPNPLNQPNGTTNPAANPTGLPSIPSDIGNLLGGLAGLIPGLSDSHNTAADTQFWQDAVNRLSDQANTNTATNAAYVQNINGRANQADTADDAYTQSISGMYSPGSPEALLMQQQMDAKDAASGRNSQYGVRAVDLAGQLATLKGNLMTTSAYSNALNHTTGNGLLTSSPYEDAMGNKSSTDILENPIYNKDQMAYRGKYDDTNNGYISALQSLLGGSSSGLGSLLSNLGNLGSSAISGLSSLFGGSGGGGGGATTNVTSTNGGGADLNQNMVSGQTPTSAYSDMHNNLMYPQTQPQTQSQQAPAQASYTQPAVNGPQQVSSYMSANPTSSLSGLFQNNPNMLSGLNNLFAGTGADINKALGAFNIPSRAPQQPSGVYSGAQDLVNIFNQQNPQR